MGSGSKDPQGLLDHKEIQDYKDVKGCQVCKVQSDKQVPRGATGRRLMGVLE